MVLKLTMTIIIIIIMITVMIETTKHPKNFTLEILPKLETATRIK